MRLRWFRNLKSPWQTLVLLGLILVSLAFYIPLSKYIKPAVTSLLLPPLKFSEDISANARYIIGFQDLVEENKRLKNQINKLTAQLGQLQEATLENQRLRNLLSLPQRKNLQTTVALVIGKDSSNWTNIAMINKGTASGLKEGMPVVLGDALVGKVIESAPFIAKVALILDFNSKVPAKISRTREEGLVFGTLEGGRNILKIKYIQDVQLKDQIISSGLGNTFPKGFLIGEVVNVEEAKDSLYKVAEIQPAVDFSTLEEVMEITGPLRF